MPEHSERQLRIDVGRRIVDTREERGWTQSQLARRSGVSRQLTSKYEAGESLPGKDKLEKIARALQVSTQFLLEGTRGLLAPTASDQPPRAGAVTTVLRTIGDWAMPGVVIDYVLHATETALRALRITNDDLGPEIKRGDFVFIDTSRTRVTDDGIYVVSCEKSGSLTLGRMTPDIASDQPIYGRVVGHFRAI